jgi:transaldolase
LTPNATWSAGRERIIELYQAEGHFRSDRVLIKIAATWEGIQAAARLEQAGAFTAT